MCPEVRSSTRSYEFGESKTSVRFAPSTLVKAGVFTQSGLPGKFTRAIFETWAVTPVDPLSLTLNLEIPPSDMKDNAKTNWWLSDHALAALDLRTTLTSDRSFASPERTTYWTSKYDLNGLVKIA